MNGLLIGTFVFGIISAIIITVFMVQEYRMTRNSHARFEEMRDEVRKAWNDERSKEGERK